MLRHKYTKKRLKNSRKKRTRKQRGSGGKSSTSSEHRAKQRRIGNRLNRSRLNQSSDDTLSPEEKRNLAQFKALELGEKCDAVNHVNDGGSIDCPKTRSLARKKTMKFHEDRNPGCKEYANDMMVQYNKTCYGDNTNTDRKWDKADKAWQNPNFPRFYQDPTTREYIQSTGEQQNYNNSENIIKCENIKCSTCIGENCKCGRLGVVKDGNKVGYNGYGVNGDEVCHNNSIKTQGEFYNSPPDTENKLIDNPNENKLPSSCKKPTKKMICRYCEGEGVTDPKCKCCAGTDMAKEAIAKEQNQQPSETNSEKTLTNNTCFISQPDPNSGVKYWVERNPDTTFTGKTQWEEPPLEEQCNSEVPLQRVDLNQPIIVTQPAQPDVLALENQQPSETNSEKTLTNNTCFISQPDPNSGVKYWVERNPDTTFTGKTQWEEPPLEEQCKDLNPTWDASKTIGSCREMDLHPGTEYWINPTDGSMSFEPIDGVEKQTVTEETDYYYNTDGKTTFDPSDGTCAETTSETKEKTKEDEFISLFFTSHFNKMQELDNASEIKVIQWLSNE